MLSDPAPRPARLQPDDRPVFAGDWSWQATAACAVGSLVGLPKIQTPLFSGRSPEGDLGLLARRLTSTPAFVIGNITRDPQLNHTSDGTPVVILSLADNTRRLVDGQWVDAATTYWEVVCFGPQAEHMAHSLARDARAIAVGVFRTRIWRDQNGVERCRLEVVAEEIGASLRWATAQVAKANTSG